jgi:hypothetical protein
MICFTFLYCLCEENVLIILSVRQLYNDERCKQVYIVFLMLQKLCQSFFLNLISNLYVHTSCISLMYLYCLFLGGGAG